MNDLVV